MHTFFISRPLCWCDIIATGNWLSVFCMVTSSNGNIFRVTGHLCGEGPVSSPHKSQRRGALMLFLICVWINVWVNNGEAGDLRRYRAHYEVIVMWHTIRKAVKRLTTRSCGISKQRDMGLEFSDCPILCPWRFNTSFIWLNGILEYYRNSLGFSFNFWYHVFASFTETN